MAANPTLAQAVEAVEGVLALLVALLPMMKGPTVVILPSTAPLKGTRLVVVVH